VKVVTVEQMRAIEQRCADADVPWQQLMENAGLAVALEVKRYVEDIAGLNVLVLIGPGNNGGDGLVVARHLKDWGASVDIYLCADRPQGDPQSSLTTMSADTHLGTGICPSSCCMADRCRCI